MSAVASSLALEVALVRIDLQAAMESQDGEAALCAIAALLKLAERAPELLSVDETAAPKPAVPSTARQMTSRYAGSCSVCSDRYRKGDLIYWDPESRTVTCARCSVGEYFGAAK